MSRPIILSNGELHVGLNQHGMVHDFYYPYVGQENHTAAKHLQHRVGVWVDNQFSWLDDGSWQFKRSYHYGVLISHLLASNEELGVKLEFDDFVDSTSSSFLRSIHMINNGPAREIRLFMHQVFVLSDSYATDTAQYLPGEDAVMHYKGHRVMIASGMHSDGRPCDEWSVGLFGIEGHEGTYRDAEDGHLSRNPNEHGRVDSVISFHCQVAENSSARVGYWVVAATTQREALRLHHKMQTEGVIHHLLHTTMYWRHWAQKAIKFAAKLPVGWRSPLMTSVLLLNAHHDTHGAVMASTDTTMLNYWRDSYAYCWPRDGAYAMWPLIRLGYQQEPLKFFSFCRRVMHHDGYLQHKYQSDGALGSSWHSHLHNGQPVLPIQEDETALVLFLFAQFYTQHQDEELLREYYPTMLRPMADFLASYVDDATGLPRNSYDLWEQRYGSSTYTTAVVYAALLEAAALAEVMGETDKAVAWRVAGEDIQRAAHQHLFNERRGFFYRGIEVGGTVPIYDETIDASSFFGAFMFGLFDPKSAHMKRAYQVMSETIVDPDNLTLPRYEHDDYLRVESDKSNVWFITSLWHAQYLIENGKHDDAKKIVDWVVAHGLDTGVLSEQVAPSGAQVSVAPLAWSHAELVSTLLDMVNGEKP